MGGMNDATINKAPLVISAYIVVFVKYVLCAWLGEAQHPIHFKWRGGANGFITVKEHRARIRELD